MRPEPAGHVQELGSDVLAQPIALGRGVVDRDERFALQRQVELGRLALHTHELCADGHTKADGVQLYRTCTGAAGEDLLNSLVRV